MIGVENDWSRIYSYKNGRVVYMFSLLSTTSNYGKKIVHL